MPFKKSLAQKEHGFTLIELIIVVVIIGILALVAIPRYFANVAKAQKAQVYANLETINKAMSAYYAVYGKYPRASIFPIVVTLDGDTIMEVANPDPSQIKWEYYTGSGGCAAVMSEGSGAYKQPSRSCYYALCISGYTHGTCTP